MSRVSPMAQETTCWSYRQLNHFLSIIGADEIGARLSVASISMVARIDNAHRVVGAFSVHPFAYAPWAPRGIPSIVTWGHLRGSLGGLAPGQPARVSDVPRLFRVWC